MDYMFSTKYLLNISTSIGFKFYMALHLRGLGCTTSELTSKILRSTLSLYQSTMKGDEVKKADSVELVMEIHKEIDAFLLGMPNSIARDVNVLAYHQMLDSSLENRMKRITA
jgi:hypothetical protein